jgi:KaiC/GvpD/RAD55 family RecA-like ATPase/predicted hydrocarbon binding protein
MASLAQLQEVPLGKTVLLVGPPGAGKSTFCQQAALNSLAMDRPVIYVTTEYSQLEAERLLKEKGLPDAEPNALSFVDAFAQTVGLAAPRRADTISANCQDLNSLSIAITKLQQRIGKQDILLAFDSLTSPYLFNKEEVHRFMTLCLAKFAAEGNSALVLMDEGCGKEEDLGAMMSVADGIIRMEMRESLRIINVVKHPNVAPIKIETPITWTPVILHERFDPKVVKGELEAAFFGPGKPIRTEVGDFVNIFWKNFASWSGMLWDPKRFPTMAYELDKDAHARSRELIAVSPWRVKLFMKLFVPKSLSQVKDMKKWMTRILKTMEKHGYGIGQYLEEASRKDEHYFRLHESCSCWGFDNVGARLAFHQCGEWAGGLKGVEGWRAGEERDWNIVETKCIGTGSPYCEFKAVPMEIDELKGCLESIDSSIVEKVHNRLMDQLTGFLIHGKPLPERPTLGSMIFFEEMHHVTGVPALFSERYRMALRMGGAKSGKEVGDRLIESEITGDEAIKRVFDFMEYCKVGKIILGKTIRMKENCETFGLQTGQPSCFFTTGFLNGLYSTVKNQHVRETKCIGLGDPYCEWEFR